MFFLIEILNDYLITCESRYMLGHLTCNGFFCLFLIGAFCNLCPFLSV